MRKTENKGRREKSTQCRSVEMLLVNMMLRTDSTRWKIGNDRISNERQTDKQTDMSTNRQMCR